MSINTLLTHLTVWRGTVTSDRGSKPGTKMPRTQESWSRLTYTDGPRWRMWLNADTPRSYRRVFIQRVQPKKVYYVFGNRRRSEMQPQFTARFGRTEITGSWRKVTRAVAKYLGVSSWAKDTPRNLKRAEKRREQVDQYWRELFAAEAKAKREQQARWRKAGITARKYGGDDMYSWAVFIHGYPFVTGISQSQVQYYKNQALGRNRSEV